MFKLFRLFLLTSNNVDGLKTSNLKVICWFLYLNIYYLYPLQLWWIIGGSVLILRYERGYVIIYIPYSREQKHVSISNTPMLLIEINSNSNIGCQKYSGFSAHLDNKQKRFFPKKNRRVTIRDCKKSDFLNSNTC